MIGELINFVLNISQTLGYGGIVFLMALESSFIPFPSEIIILPAAYLASQGQMNVYYVVISGVAGSLIGAIFNYFLALYLGRKIVYSLSETRLAKILLINSKKIEKSENFFLKYGNVSTFFGRLIPVIRQLISLPAGFSKMNFKNFIFYTFLGSAIWVIILAVLGYQFGANIDKILDSFKLIKHFIIYAIILALAVIIFFIILKNIKKLKNK